jgi:hypothetical protein
LYYSHGGVITDGNVVYGNSRKQPEGSRRQSIVQTLATRVDLGGCRVTLEQSADALDSLICAFAALAVVNNNT